MRLRVSALVRKMIVAAINQKIQKPSGWENEVRS